MKGGNGEKQGPGPDNPDEAWNSNGAVTYEREDGSTGKPPWAGEGGGGGGGKPPGAGTKKGDLFGDQWIVLRDLDPTDGGGDGEPIIDGVSGDVIAIGYDPDGLLGPEYDPDGDGFFPIYATDPDGDGDYEIPAELEDFVQEVELERANVARAPDKVVEKALLAALDKIETAWASVGEPNLGTEDPDDVLGPEDVIRIDPAGRIQYTLDQGLTYSTIDAPLENLALYQYLMTPPGGVDRSFADTITGHWPEALAVLVGGDLENPDWTEWDPSALMGAAWSKTGKITLDAMIYENTALEVNAVDYSGGGAPTIDYFDFSTKEGESSEELFDYTRSVRHDDTWIKWFEDLDGDPDTLEAQYATVFDAVFGERDADGYVIPDSGIEWGAEEDVYFALNAEGTDFVEEDAGKAGINDWAQAADDARAIINFMHETGAIEVDVSEVPDALLLG